MLFFKKTGKYFQAGLVSYFEQRKAMRGGSGTGERTLLFSEDSFKGLGLYPPPADINEGTDNVADHIIEKTPASDINVDAIAFFTDSNAFNFAHRCFL